MTGERQWCGACGVEFRGDTCPLCGGEGRDEPIETSHFAELPDPPVPMQLRRILHRIVLLIASTTTVVITIVAIGTDGYSWLPLAVTPIIAAYAIVAVPVLTQQPAMSLAASGAITGALLVLLDYFANGSLDWSPQAAIPITGAAYLVVGAVWWVAKHAPATLAVASGLVGVSIISLVVDISTAFLDGRTQLFTWSPFVVVSTVPIAAFLLVLRQTVLRFVDVKRRLHM